MVRGNRRSRTYRRIHIKTPSGKNKIIYKKRKIGDSKCADCGKRLYLKKSTQNKFKNITKSKKRPERPFGGYLCSKCTRKKIIELVRKK